MSSGSTDLRWLAGAMAVSALAFVWVGAGGWPEDPHPCLRDADCYCEAPRPGLVAQPANTWSCLGWAGAALWMALDASRRKQRTRCASTRSLLLRGSFYSTLWIVVVSLLTPGGMFFHASLTDWGGKVDQLSMYLLVDFWIAFNLAALRRWPKGLFLACYLAGTAILLVPRVILEDEAAGLILFGLLIALGCATEVGVVRTRALRGDLCWAGIALGSFGLAHGVQALLPCEPRSVLQAHALLHLIEVATVVAMYRHLIALRPSDS